MNTPTSRRALLRLAVPIAGPMLLSSSMGLVDVYFVAREGEAAVAGVGLGSLFTLATLLGPFGILHGIKLVVGEAVGGSDEQRVADTRQAGILLALGFALVSGAVLALLVSVGGGLLQTEASRSAFAEYTWVRALGIAFPCLSVALREARYGAADTTLPLVLAFAAALVNAALDAWLIGGLEMGPRGAAVATVAADAIYVAGLFAADRARDARLGHFRPEIARAILALGGPIGFQWLLEFGAFTAIGAALARLGDGQAAAHHVLVQLFHLASLPGLAIGEAAAIRISQARGARERSAPPLLFRAATSTASFIGMALGLSVAIFLGRAGHALVGGREAELALRAAVPLALLFPLLNSANQSVQGTLRGLGDTVSGPRVVLPIAWLLSPPLTWLLAAHLDLGTSGAWIAFCLEIALTIGLLLRVVRDRLHAVAPGLDPARIAA